MKKIPTILALLAALDVEAAKKSLAGIDKELRGKAPAVPEVKPDSRYGRLSQAFERAYVGSNPHDWRGVYESPDGIVYYTETIRGETRCSMTGPVESPSGRSNGAIRIGCPANAEWKKY